MRSEAHLPIYIQPPEGTLGAASDAFSGSYVMQDPKKVVIGPLDAASAMPLAETFIASGSKQLDT